MKQLYFFIIFSLIIILCCNYTIKESFSSTSEIYKCFGNVMTKQEDDILTDLINKWTEVAKKLDIKWSVCAGTYIGLKRHQGRIPWDDDFDITIMKEDVSKMNQVSELLKSHNIGLAEFWGGYKIYFTDERAIKVFNKYEWNWPFIDIFALKYEGEKFKRERRECFYLKKEELPLKKEKFGNGYVNVFQNPSLKRTSVKNRIWEKELVDTRYRHQIEKRISNKCSKKYIT